MKLLPILLLLSTTAASAGEKHDDFTTILKRVESHYGKRHMRIPMMGLVTFASHFTRPLGASDFKLAIIEGVGYRNDDSTPDFEPGADWRPFIRTTSRTGERTVMYGREEGRAIRTLMLVIDKDEAVVMHMRLDPNRFTKLLAEKSYRF